MPPVFPETGSCQSSKSTSPTPGMDGALEALLEALVDASAVKIAYSIGCMYDRECGTFSTFGIGLTGCAGSQGPAFEPSPEEQRLAEERRKAYARRHRDGLAIYLTPIGQVAWLGLRTQLAEFQRRHPSVDDKIQVSISEPRVRRIKTLKPEHAVDVEIREVNRREHDRKIELVLSTLQSLGYENDGYSNVAYPESCQIPESFYDVREEIDYETGQITVLCSQDGALFALFSRLGLLEATLPWGYKPVNWS